MALCASVLLAGPASAQAPDERQTGLPPRIDWTFNFGATWGSFGFANSLFDNPKEDVDEDLSDQWFEGSIKPALSGVFKTAAHGELYGKVSAVGEQTYGSIPERFGIDVSSFKVDDLAIGWRSGSSSGAGENVLDFTVGRTPYVLGHAMLLGDGTGEGGSRGGYWTNARKSFEMAAIARFRPGAHLVEAFYLDKDDLPERDTGTRLWGTNYELSIGEDTTLGATYLKFWARPLLPLRDGLNVFNLRAYTSPIPAVPDLSFEVEYAAERNGDAFHSNAWNLQGAYEMSQLGWTPTFSYRHAFFQGDDPATPRREGFDPLLPGFYDWGTWWQGEIAGEYFLSNSNQISDLIRVDVTPNDAITGGVLFFNFTLDHPGAIAPGVTSKSLATEADLYVDWQINKNLAASFVLAFGNPGLAVQQTSGRTKNFSYGMVFLAYSY